MSLLARYTAVLSGTGAAAPFTACLLARLSLSTTGLALLLTAYGSTGSYGAAGLVAAAYAVALAVCAPMRARRADRDGPRGVLLVLGVAHPLALVTVVLLAHARAGTPLLVAGALLAGSTIPPIGGVIRALWGRLVPPDQLPAAYSLDSVVIEACFLAGPLIVAALGALSGPSAALLAAAALCLSGTLWLASTAALRMVVPHDGPPGSRLGPLVSPAVRALLVAFAFVGIGFGAIEVAVSAFVEAEGGGAATTGVLLGIWSGGSMLGGLAYGAVRLSAPLERQQPLLVLAVAVGGVLPLLATGPAVMAVLLVLYGSTFAPYSTVNNLMLNRVTPPGTLTQVFAWSTTVIFGGAALGSALAGWLVDAVGIRAGLGVTALSGIAALLAALAGRSAIAAPMTSRV